MTEEKKARKVTLKGLVEACLWLAAVGIGLVIVLAIGVAVADVVHWHSFRRDHLQGLDFYPKALADHSLATPHGITTLTLSGCSIDLPWENLRTGASGTSLRIAFSPAGDIDLMDPAEEPDLAGGFRGERGGPSLAPVFGAATLQSNYNLLAAELNFNPAELSPLPWGHDHARQLVLASFKATMVLTHQPQPIYSIDMGNVRGFQFGDASQMEPWVELHMFDAKGRQFRVNLLHPQTSSATWTQPEINFIIHSMRCDPAAYAAARQAWETRINQHR